MGWLLLAAGQANRFGSDKLSASMTTGRSVFAQTASNLLQTPWPVLAVVQPGHPNLGQTSTDLGLGVTECRDAPLGMSHSLAWGVKQLADDWSWVGIVLADMPLIDWRTLAALGRLARHDNIVLPVFQPRARQQAEHRQTTGQPSASRLSSAEHEPGARPGWGHPVCFGRDFFPSLAGLSGDRGARDLILANPARITEFHTDDPGILQDIDTPEDLAALNQTLALGR